METLATILFFALGAVVLLMTAAIAFKAKVPKLNIVFDISKYLLVALVTGITLSYGNIIAGIGIGVVGFGSLLYMNFLVKKNR